MENELIPLNDIRNKKESTREDDIIVVQKETEETTPINLDQVEHGSSTNLSSNKKFKPIKKLLYLGCIFSTSLISTGYLFDPEIKLNLAIKIEYFIFVTAFVLINFVLVHKKKESLSNFLALLKFIPLIIISLPFTELNTFVLKFKNDFSNIFYYSVYFINLVSLLLIDNFKNILFIENVGIFLLGFLFSANIFCIVLAQNYVSIGLISLCIILHLTGVIGRMKLNERILPVLEAIYFISMIFVCDNAKMNILSTKDSIKNGYP